MHADHEDVDPFLPLAEKIAEGSTVHLEEAARQVAGVSDISANDEDSNRRVIGALIDIAAIGAAHQGAEHAFDLMQPAPLHAPRRWAHLTILEKIGEGEFGEVFRAHDDKLQIDVALKLSSVDVGRSADASKILDEARLLAKVRHPNVVRVYGADHKQGRVGMWMDLVNGQDLEELAKTQGFGAKEAVNVGIELCRALAAVHSAGVLHGDIKAHNVIRRDGGQIVLVDFSASRPISYEPRPGADLIGTPVYLAPEVLNGQPRSVASDVYSLGVMLFHLVTNSYPVYASSHQAFLDAHNRGERKNLRDLRTDLPGAFIQVVARATAPEPQARFATAGSFEAALVDVLAPPPPVPLPTPPVWPRWVAGIGACAALGFGAAALWRPSDAPGTTSMEARTGRGIDIVLPRESYDIDAAFYRKVNANREERLVPDSRLVVDDEIHLSVQTSVPTYLYVVNEDERGEAFLLFPDPEHQMTNPIAANTKVRVPHDLNWKVSTVGGREHFIVFASTEQLSAFADAFLRLPTPQLAEGPRLQRLPAGTAERLRGVGRLAPATSPDKPASNFRDVFTKPLTGPETARGLWVRRLTVENSDARH